jgi:undecaprenyl-diphosphatase
LETVVNHILAWLQDWGYYVVFFMTFLENSAFLGLVAPGEWTLILAGLLASQGTFELSWLYPAAISGAVLGDLAGYLLGRHGSYRILIRYGRYFRFKESYLEMTGRYFDRHGGKTVFIGRFVPFVKVFAPMTAGIGRMPFGRFLAWNIPGVVLATSLLITGGFLFGESWQRINRYIGWGAGLAFAVMVVIIATAVVIRRRRRIEEK